jgi:sialidase-1
MKLGTFAKAGALILLCIVTFSKAADATNPERPAAAVAPEKINLFEAGTGGYVTYRIPGIVVTKAGTILAYCEARKSGVGDWDTSDVQLRRSTDGGRTWEEPRKMAEAPADAQRNPAAVAKKLKDTGKTTNNPVAIADPVSGAVHFLYCVNYEHCYYMRSDDDGKTFSKPVKITAAFEKFRPEYDWKVIATGPGHGIRLTSGRLLVPVWLSLSTGGNAHHPSCVATIYSDDEGKSWNLGDIAVKSTAETPDPNETTAAQLADGRVMLNTRSESHKNRRLITTSANGATGWSTPVFDDGLFDPICFGSVVSVPSKGEDRLLFSNPDSSAASPGKSSHMPRRNLTVRMSPDGGAHWPVAKVLEPGIAGYSDLAVGPDGTVYCLYERGGIKQEMFHAQYLCLARFNLNWLSSKDPEH